ncbi:AAA family ATPase [Nitrosopumilus adriaticus]|uniref:Uncharacterized protein n=1 Tax=Nitrosopumilus adriaticus TaxID=1580092 RepID=A0A0D5C3R2_9ARCH|nr:AAA family ATPase [Nitrosopumilus adriaticus]AJW71042.1 hypothetical protein NADRNF5_1356 [Nitrosopumilus adriaticus]
MQIIRIRLKNFLSFGTKMQELEFSDLNTIVGPNDSGKTNVFRAIELVKRHINQRNVPAEAYYHNLDFEKPYEIEIDIKFDQEEKEILLNFLVCAIIHQDIRPKEKENQRRNLEILKKILLGKGEKFFSDFCEELTIVVDTEGKSRYPPDIYFKFNKNNQYLYFQSYRLTNNLKKRDSHTIRNISDIILTQARNEIPKLNDCILNIKQKLPNLDNFSYNVFDHILEITEDSVSSEFGGFRLTEFEANKETFPEFIRTRNFIRSVSPEDESASFVDIVSHIFKKSIIKTSDIRARPKVIQSPKDLQYFDEMINISGENLAKILFSLANSDNPKLKTQYREVTNEFKKITNGLELEVQVKPIKSKIKKRHLRELEKEFDRLDNATNIAMADEEIEIVKDHLYVQVIKNNIPIPIEFAAAGIIELAILLTAVIGHKNKVLLLDEPALNLHSILQRRVLQLIQKAISKNKNQVILITHSPYLLNPENFKNSWKITSPKPGSTVVNLKEIIDSMNTNEREKTLTRLYNSEIRSILFQHGVVLVEGPSDKIVIEKTDRYLTDNQLDGPNIEDNEWMILDVGGKDSFSLLLKLVKKLKIPHTSVLDYDSLMECTRKIFIDGQEVITSSAINAIEKSEGLSQSEKSFIKKIRSSIIPKKEKSRTDKIITRYWYDDNLLKKLNTIARKHNMYVLIKDLEGSLQTSTTSKDSKPLRATEHITELLSENKIPKEIKLVMKFIKTKIKN